MLAQNLKLSYPLLQSRKKNFIFRVSATILLLLINFYFVITVPFYIQTNFSGIKVCTSIKWK